MAGRAHAGDSGRHVKASPADAGAEEPEDSPMTEAELAAHHEAARNASIADWLALGEEQGREDALASIVALTVSGRRAARLAGKKRMRDRTGRLRHAGISEDRITAWLDAHT